MDTLISLLPLWIYCAGVPIAFGIAAYRLGIDPRAHFDRRFEAWRKRDSYYDRPEIEFYYAGYAALYFILSGLWPISLFVFFPLKSLFQRGQVQLATQKELQKQLTAAEKEIEKIRAQEGWK